MSANASITVLTSTSLDMRDSIDSKAKLFSRLSPILFLLALFIRFRAEKDRSTLEVVNGKVKTNSIKRSLQLV